MKTYKNKSIVSGLSVDEILNMDYKKLNKLNKSDMQKITGRLVSAGNKRLRRFIESEDISPAVRHILSAGQKGYDAKNKKKADFQKDYEKTKFSTKNKSLQELKEEFKRIKNFMQNETGTRKGWEDVKDRTIDTLEKHGIYIDKKDFNKFWEVYEKFSELDPSVENYAFKYEVLEEIKERLNEYGSIDELAISLSENLSKTYEKNREEVSDIEYGGMFKME